MIRIFESMETLISIPHKTVKDYLQLPEGAPYQLINGQLIMSPAPKRSHQKLAVRISALILSYCDKTLAGEVYVAPFDVYLDDENVVQPDICFIAQANIGILTEEGAQGAPDMVIELLSPSNAYYDVRAKLQLYEKFGVKEYFIVDPQDNMVVAYKLTDGRYKETYRLYNKIISEVLGTEIVWS